MTHPCSRIRGAAAKVTIDLTLRLRSPHAQMRTIQAFLPALSCKRKLYCTLFSFHTLQAICHVASLLWMSGAESSGSSILIAICCDVVNHGSCRVKGGRRDHAEWFHRIDAKCNQRL